MSITQSILGFAVGGGCAAAAALVNHLITRWRIDRMLPRISKIYGLLDPLAAEVSGRWSGSQLRFGTEVLVALLADGKLSDEEVRWATEQVLARFNPIKAADQARDFSAVAAASAQPMPGEQVIDQIKTAVERGSFTSAGPVAAARSIRSALKGVL